MLFPGVEERISKRPWIGNRRVAFVLAAFNVRLKSSPAEPSLFLAS